MKVVSLLRLFCVIFFLFGFVSGAKAQSAKLERGFDAGEYADMLWLAFYGFADSLKDVPAFTLKSGTYSRIMRSPEVGLYNQCEVYLRNDSVVILSLRGTVNKPESWLENFYAAMVPARGSLKLTDDYTFHYNFAKRENALVHIGWTVGTGFLAKEYMPVLETLLARGLSQVIVTGHSQGGALSFLCTSHLYYMLKEKYPNMVLKTYASAAPKPGNLYYAYDLEHITGNGFAYRIVNADDWVPETPISVQGIGDFNGVNPISGASETIKQQKFPDRLVLNHIYNKMRKGSDKAAKRYRKYLGNGVGKMVKKALPGYEAPVYSVGNNYMTAGAPIILMPDEEYRKAFVFDGKNVFIHHMYKPYLFLLNLHYAK
jgi:hypothetical protein